MFINLFFKKMRYSLKAVFKSLLFLVALSFVSAKSFAIDITGTVNVVDTSGKAVEDKEHIVVYLIGEDIDSKKYTPKDINLSMSSKQKKFEPSFVAGVVGSTVTFPNEDRILHNVFSLSKAKTFDLGLYPKGEKKTVTFDKAGVIKVYCNIHPKMVGYVVVLNNPFYGVTDKNGKFTIKDAPMGDYKIAAWHRFGKGDTKPIKIDKSKDVKIDLVRDFNMEIKVIEKSRSIKHKNKWGKPYKAKY